MTSETLLEIRFSGGGILPENIRAGELAEILSSIEDMLTALVTKEHPKLTKDDLLLGLVNIEGGSVHLQFSSQLPEITHPAFVKVTKSIKNRDFATLPPATIKSINNISSFVRKKNCEAEFISKNGKAKVLATITPDVNISPPGFLKGDTTLYGQIIRVGGRNPKAMIETAEGVTVYCDMENEELARELGERLYMWVNVKGKATWDSLSLHLEDFRINEVEDFGGSAVQAFEELTQIAGNYFKDIENVEGYVAHLRGLESGE